MKKNKSIIIVLILIFVIIVFMFVLAILSYKGTIKLNNKKELSSIENEDEQTIKLNDKLRYKPNAQIGGYEIYNEDGIIIDTVNDEDGLEFYRENPDFIRGSGIYQEPTQNDIEDMMFYNVDNNIEESTE